MIKVSINHDNDFISDFKIVGHANYDTLGKDIVCASVSSISIASINLALKFDKDSIEVVQKEGFLFVKVLKHDDNINKIFINMEELLRQLSNDYKKYIKII